MKKIKILLLFAAILFSVTQQAQNTIEIVSPPASVEGNTHVDITFNYTLAVKGHAYIRFKNGPVTENNITAAAVHNLEAGSGTLTVSLEIPRSFNGAVLPLGTHYNYQAQLFDTGWAGLATEDYNGVTLTAAANFIEMTDYPTTVNSNGSVDVTFDYATNKGLPVYAFIRLHNASGAQVASTSPAFELSAAAGTKTINLAIPGDVAIGEGYEYRALLFHPSNWGVAFATSKAIGITVEAGIAPTYEVNIVNPPTTVVADRIVDFDLSYIIDESVTAAFVLIRFKGPTGNLEQAYKEVNDNEGTVTIGLKTPLTAGTYSLQAQLYTKGWSELVTYNLPGITVEEYVPTGENTLEIVNTSADPINNGSLREVTINYNLLQKSKILLEVRDKAEVQNSKQIGSIWVELPASNGSITLDLIVDNGFPGTENRIQASLYDLASTPNPISIATIPHLIVAKGDGTITYRGQPFNSGQNALFAEALGEGYYSNYYIATGWKGPLKMKFGAVGSPSWIEFENQNVLSDNHKEFDIKIQKFSWHEDKDYFNDRGYPTAVKDIPHDLIGTLNGQWSPGSRGKGQINMTAWVTANGDMSGDRVDIIVHAFDNGGNFRKKYDDEQGRFRNLGEFTSTNGFTYQVLRAKPGFLGEVASYNLVPDAIVQEDPRADYTNDVITSSIDMKDIINNLIAKEAAYTGAQGKIAINENWLINGLEWTVVGQSGNLDTDGQMIPNGQGKFTFNSYTIPNLSSLPLSTDNFNSEFKNLTMYPNPFTNAITIKLGDSVTEPVSVELFTMDGRKIKTIQNNKISEANSTTINTSNLSKGIYLVRVTSNKVQASKILIKN